ncbi:hypothetical protein L211DRAFT_417526 [Terfezia boudieri ATCC MYA-4762]|uniref:Uncharacterized protein n=1 Tax=Terfezia boudieri ATCC MYA-4762 TaxID=1051890 RepID=A0A3N4LUS9_9PEZI|nr:hypothetical protein L211DRAFT_417526 [Terfezia boudieri ATCC MYA-4762]
MYDKDHMGKDAASRIYRNYHSHAEKAEILQDIHATVETTACSYLLALDEVEEEEEIEEEHIQDLLAVQEIIAAHRYLSRDTSAGRPDIDILNAYIYEYPETAFLALFRMHRASFWQLVQILTQAGTEGYWDHRAIETGRSPRPIYQQAAMALYMLGGGGGTRERTRIALNIGFGTVWNYTWRTIKLLYGLLPEYIRWPLHPVDHSAESGHHIFRHCIGFLDGSNIVLSLQSTRKLISLEKRTMASTYKQYAIGMVNSYRYLWVTLRVHMTLQYGNLLLFIEQSVHISIQRSIF